MIELNVTNLVGGNIVITTSSSGGSGGSEIPADWDGIKLRVEFSDGSTEEYNVSRINYGEQPVTDWYDSSTQQWISHPVRIFLGTCLKNDGFYSLGTGTLTSCNSITEVTTLETISYWNENYTIYALLDAFPEGITVHCTDGDFTLSYPS